MSRKSTSAAEGPRRRGYHWIPPASMEGAGAGRLASRSPGRAPGSPGAAGGQPAVLEWLVVGAGVHSRCRPGGAFLEGAIRRLELLPAGSRFRIAACAGGRGYT